MKLIVAIICLGSQLTVRCQIDHELRDSIFNAAKEKIGDQFIGELCDFYLSLAESQAQHDTLILPQFSFDYSISSTFERWVNFKYLIHSWNYVSGDMIPSETACFDDYMAALIKAKFGENFFIENKIIADSLNTIGKGYVAPSFGLSTDKSLREFLRTHLDLDSLLEARPMNRYIFFEIDKEGKISSLKLLEGGVELTAVDPNDELQLNFERIFKDSPLWNPSRFLGEPIVGYYFFYYADF